MLVISACASRGKQTEAFLKSSPGIPSSFEVQEVPFIEQSKNYCGPASVAMVMNWAGHPITADEVATQIFTPGKKGSLQEDILGASRRQGMLAIGIHGLPSLLNEIAAGHPVIVLENLLASWYPQWHYAVAIGYDLKKRELLLHSGSKAYKVQSLDKFEESWSLADYWGVVILPPSKLAVSVDDVGHAESAAILEQLGKTKEAEEVYQNILKKWPDSFSALIGLGNTRYTANDFKGSVHYLSEAVLKYPKSAVAWHNLATAQGADGKLARARKSALMALKLTDPKDLQTYKMSLGKWIN